MVHPFRKPIPPDARAPAEVRFLDVRIEPWEDRKRFKVLIHLTPFQEFPNLEVSLFNAQAEEIAHTSVIENSEEKLVFTMHLRGNPTPGQPYSLQVTLSYPDLPKVDQTQVSFTL